MGMGAPKQGTTLNLNSGQQVPVQGGKGGGRPMPMPPQGGKGAGQPVQLGKGVGRPVQPGQYPGQYPGHQYPYTPIGAQGGKGGTSNVPGQPQTTLNLNSGQQVPVQGGKGGTSNVPGYAQPYVNALNPQVQQPQVLPMQPQVQQPTNPLYDFPMINKPPEVQQLAPGQVPAQGGKAPLTPEQQAQIQQPLVQQPLVQPPPPGMPSPAEAYAAYQRNLATSAGSGLTPVYQPPPGIQQPQVLPALSRPQVLPMKPMPADQAQGLPMRPQVLPQKPMPANQAQGLMGLKNILAGKR